MRISMPREFYIPKDAQQVPVDVDAAIYSYTASNGKPAACAFIGKAAKPSWRFWFASEEQRQKRIQETVASCQYRATEKAKYKAERSKPHTLTVGAILYASWGYDQTNINFYQVTRIVGPSTVEVREIASRSVSDQPDGFSSMSDHVVACPDQFVGEATKHRANSTNSLRIDTCRHASLYDGKPLFRSWYA